jgi:hypothetical protein
MVIDMNESRLNTVAQLRAFLEGTLEVQFYPLNNDTQRYAFIGALLKRLRYAQLRRADKGVVLRYLERTTGYSRQQLTRLVGRARAGGVLTKRYRAPAHGFARKFSPLDVALLAETDALHGTLSGPATVHLLRRAYGLYGDPRYQRLAGLSVSHLYNLRAQAGYQAKRGLWTKTKGASVAIGQRRAPAPEGRAGFIRIDSVHQGDFDGLKGVYHINAVDCVTQFELVATCERISEAYLLPALESLLEDFPFTVLGFHADNGSEYINHTVARLLDKLRVEATQVAPAHQQRQRPGRDQERGHRAQAPGLRPHPPALCCPSQCLLPGVPQPVCELPPPLLLPPHHHRQQRQNPQTLPLRGHDDPLREAEVTAQRAGLPQAGHELPGPGCLRGSHQRQPGRTASEPGQGQAVSIHPTSIQTGRLISPQLTLFRLKPELELTRPLSPASAAQRVASRPTPASRCRLRSSAG